MDERETKVFDEIARLRSEEGLGDKLERYRLSRDQYEKLRRGRDEPAPSVPLERSRRQAKASGRIRGIVDGHD